MSDRTVSPQVSEEDKATENMLRPSRFSDLVGRKQEKRTFGILVESAKKRGDSLDHILLYGPPGLGKTTIARILANEMNCGVRSTSGPAIEKPGDLAAILSNMKEGELLFIDEIHRLNKTVEEILYPAMEDYSLDIIIGKGPSARTVTINLPKFTLVGATTRVGALGAPLRDRFGLVHRLDFYNDEELENIVRRSAGVLKISISEDAVCKIACRSRGTARIANRILKRVRDYAEVNFNGKIDRECAESALKLLGIDDNGLDELDRKVLKVIINNYNGGPVGLSAVASILSEDINTLMDVCEPYLLQRGFLIRTPRGRAATQKSLEIFKQ